MSEGPSQRIVVVTGAAMGIGRATALAFGEKGDFVYVLDIDFEKGSEVAGLNEHARFVRCDVTSSEDVRDAIGQIGEESGHIDVLVNNAGGFPAQRSLEETSLDEWRQIIDLNLTSVFFITQAALPLIRQQVERRIGVLRAPPRPERPVPRKLLSRRIGPSLVCAVGRWRERVRDVGLCATHQGLLRVLERR